MSGTDTLDEVQAGIITAGLGQNTDSSVDWMIFKGNLPDIHDRAICLYETPGRPPLEAWAIVYPGVQIVVRGGPDDYTVVRKKIQDIFNALHSNEPIMSDQLVYFYSVNSGPLTLGMDEKRRIRLAWNFREMRNTPHD